MDLQKKDMSFEERVRSVSSSIDDFTKASKEQLDYFKQGVDFLKSLHDEVRTIKNILVKDEEDEEAEEEDDNDQDVENGGRWNGPVATSIRKKLNKNSVKSDHIDKNGE